MDKWHQKSEKEVVSNKQLTFVISHHLPGVRRHGARRERLLNAQRGVEEGRHSLLSTLQHSPFPSVPGALVFRHAL